MFNKLIQKAKHIMLKKFFLIHPYFHSIPDLNFINLLTVVVMNTLNGIEIKSGFTPVIAEALSRLIHIIK